VFARLRLVAGDLDAAELATPTDLDLGLDGARVADLVRRRGRLIDRRGDLALGTGMPWRASSCLPWYSSRSISGRGL